MKKKQVEVEVPELTQDVDGPAPTFAEFCRNEANKAKMQDKFVHIIAARYAYNGYPVIIGDEYLVLDDARIVFETGGFDDPKWGNMEKFHGGRRTIMIGAIESIGIMK